MTLESRIAKLHQLACEIMGIVQENKIKLLWIEKEIKKLAEEKKNGRSKIRH